MRDMVWTEVLGYIASAFVAGSLLMVSFVKLRVINLIGSATFVVYAVLINSIPLLLTNAFISCVNVYHLARIFRADVSGFSYVSIDSSRREQLQDFLAAYREDVLRFYPEFALGLAESAFELGGRIYLAIRNLRAVGFACSMPLDALKKVEDPDLSNLVDYVNSELYPERTVYVPVDYITKKYRDLGLVYKLHDRLLEDLGGNAHFVVSIVEAEARRTRRFLEQSGHVRARESGAYLLYVKTLR